MTRTPERITAVPPSVTATLNATPQAVLLVDADGRIIFDNPKADELFRCRLGELTGRGVEDLIPARLREAHAARRELFAHRQRRRPVGQMRGLVALRTDGTEMRVNISLSPLPLGEQTVTMAVVVDVESLHTLPPDDPESTRWADSSNALYSRLVQSAPIGIYRSSPDGLLLYANPALASMLGYDSVSELLGINLPTQVYENPGDREHVLRSIEASSISAGVNARLRRKDGRLITVRITSHAIRDEEGAVVCYEGAVDDVTERLQVEQDLHRIRRMESATRLAGGMSHTLSNVLTSVLGGIQLALEELSHEDTPGRLELVEAERGLLRATEMLGKLRSFSSVNDIRSERVELRAFLLAWTSHLDAVPNVDVHVNVPEEPVEVDVDPRGLMEVLENLTSNAMDAMPSGGELRVSLSASEGNGGRWAEVEIADTGTGMNDVTLELAMEPYFSTKPRQKTSSGAGLGLSLVYGIIRQHGGDVVLASTPEQGTTARFRLPLSST